MLRRFFWDRIRATINLSVEVLVVATAHFALWSDRTSSTTPAPTAPVESDNGRVRRPSRITRRPIPPPNERSVVGTTLSGEYTMSAATARDLLLMARSSSNATGRGQSGRVNSAFLHVSNPSSMLVSANTIALRAQQALAPLDEQDLQESSQQTSSTTTNVSTVVAIQPILFTVVVDPPSIAEHVSRSPTFAYLLRAYIIRTQGPVPPTVWILSVETTMQDSPNTNADYRQLTVTVGSAAEEATIGLLVEDARPDHGLPATQRTLRAGLRLEIDHTRRGPVGHVTRSTDTRPEWRGSTAGAVERRREQSMAASTSHDGRQVGNQMAEGYRSTGGAARATIVRRRGRA
uniref:Uncharacterized protein n=1 Tax=Mycena chlorophos TaxID=658473 RepID=A0ABQ0L245_MYCCL|nr:predicted protein [Mycena chlorophos]